MKFTVQLLHVYFNPHTKEKTHLSYHHLLQYSIKVCKTFVYFVPLGKIQSFFQPLLSSSKNPIFFFDYGLRQKNLQKNSSNTHPSNNSISFINYGSQTKNPIFFIHCAFLIKIQFFHP